MWNELKSPRMRRTVFLILLTALLLALILYLRTAVRWLGILYDAVFPFLFGAGLAFVLNVPMRFFEKKYTALSERRTANAKRGMSEPVITVLSLLSVLLCIAAVVALFWLLLSGYIRDSIASFRQTAESLYIMALDALRARGIDTTAIEEFCGSLSLRDLITGYFGGLSAGGSWQAIKAALSYVGSIFVILLVGSVFSIYILVSKKRLRRQTKKLLYAYIPAKRAAGFLRVAQLTADTFGGFIAGQCLVALIYALMLGCVYAILRIPFAAILAAVTGVAILIPYVGGFLSVALSVLLVGMVSPVKVIVLLVAYLIVQQIKSKIISPKIVGHKIGLPAIWALFSAIVGGSLFGLFGLVFFIPLSGVVYILIREHANSRLAEKNIVIE